MAKKLGIKLNFNLKDYVNKNWPSQVFANRIQNDVINDTIKPLIARGISPVEGQRKFKEYKALTNYMTEQDKKTKAKLKNKGYPYNVAKDYPAKKPKPANLNLSGEMLTFYKAEPIPRRQACTVGIHPDSPKDVIDRALGNNFGTEHVPARPFIPSKAGMNYNRTVTLAITKAVSETIKQTLKGKKS